MENRLVVIIEGPSGVGKDTIINKIIEKYPDKFARPINACTRPMRPNESQNNPYYFITNEEFMKLRLEGEIFEHTTRHGTFRGMRKSNFESIFNQGKIVIRDCDRYGVDAIKKEYGEDIVLSIFLTCPKEEIEKRLIERNESPDSMKARLDDYDTFILDRIYFDHIIENIDMQKTIDEILKLINQKKPIF